MKRRDFIKSFATISIAKSLPITAMEALTEVRPLSSKKIGPAAVSKNIPYYGAFREAPPLASRPQGWLREMLNRQVNGLARHHAVSGYPFNTCLWAGRIPKINNGAPWWPYEQTGYLVDGLERLGAVTGDDAVSAEARANVAYILSHVRPDGSLGPDDVGDSNWPQAIVFRAMLEEYRITGNRDLLAAMRRTISAGPPTLEMVAMCAMWKRC